MRSDVRKREKNQSTLSELKNLDKKLRALSGKPEEAAQIVLEMISAYDSAVNRGVVHRRRADRKKSRISRFLSASKKSK